MGQVNNNSKVDFVAYCRAFEVLSQFNESKSSSAVCAALDKDPDYYSVGSLFRDHRGDGSVRVPDYGVSRGAAVERGSRLLTEDGSVIVKNKRGEKVVESVDSRFARYFIAGAFGKGELKDSSGLDEGVVDGLQQLYWSCLKDSDNCLDSAPAKKVASAWQGVLTAENENAAAAKKLAERKDQIARLQYDFDKLAGEIESKEQLVVGVAPFKSRVPEALLTLEDFGLAERMLREMLVVAQAVRLADDKRRANARQQADAEQKRSELAHYRAENPKMRDRIKKAMGPYWRFTDAYDAGMKCMPMPHTFEDEYCVEKNKYDMGIWLENAAQAHPSGWRCVESKTVEVSCFKDEIGCSWDRKKTETRCVRSEPKGRDTSEKEAISEAMSYCSTTCK